MASTINRVLITGGSGFVGYWMERTQPEGLSAIYLNQYGYIHSKWEWGEWDAIVHLANISPLHVLHHLGNAKLLYASSGAVYHNSGEYADNKRKWEILCQGHTIARLFAFVGDHLKNLYAITAFIEAAKQRKPLPVWGNGQSVRSYLYGEDLGRWMWKILLEGNGIYDVGSAIPYTILEAAQVVAEVTKSSIQLVNIDCPHTVYLPDTARARELGCVETVGLKEAVQRCLSGSI